MRDKFLLDHKNVQFEHLFHNLTGKSLNKATQRFS